jgi:hypothetical protein
MALTAHRRVVNAVATAVTLAAWLGLYLWFHPHPPGIDRRPHEAAGALLAEETVKLLGPNARVIVIARDPELFQVPAGAAQLGGFLRALKKAGRTPSLVRLFKVDPLRVVTVPSGEFYDLLRQARNEDVVVSFLGPPVLSADQTARLGDKHPRVLAVCSGAMPATVDLKRLFEQRLLLAAVVNRQGLPIQGAASGSRLAFDQLFKLITGDNLSDLPAAPASPN